MSIYKKYKGKDEWYVKYPVRKDPVTGRTVYKIKKIGPQKLAIRFEQKKKEEWTSFPREI